MARVCHLGTVKFLPIIYVYNMHTYICMYIIYVHLYIFKYKFIYHSTLARSASRLVSSTSRMNEFELSLSLPNACFS
jgi:hypothetical protein